MRKPKNLENKARILHVLGTLDLGGAETMIVNVMRSLRNSEISFDFLVSGEKIGYYEQEVMALGAEVRHLTKRSQSFWKHHWEIYRIVRETGYGTLHFHTQNAFLTSVEILAAKLGGAKKIVVHCHNTMDWRNSKMLLLHKLARPLLNALTDVRLSCGNAASEWLYGTTEQVIVLPLPVVCDRYRCSQTQRDALRAEAGLTGKRVYLHVGRFSDVKNHTFLLDIFAQLLQRNENSVLLMAGDGPLRSDMEEKAQSLGMEGKAVFLGNISNVYEKMMLADVFVFPSKYEGFPTVVLEAQAAGLECIISDAITPEIAITDLVKQLPLTEQAEVWAEQIAALPAAEPERKRRANDAIREKFDVSVTVQRLMEVYAEE